MENEKFQKAISQVIMADEIRCLENSWHFKPRTVANHTIGDFIGAVFSIDNEEDAKAFYASYVDYLSGIPNPKHTPEEIANSNIGWCYGEGMTTEKIRMWNKATDARHPVLGSMDPPPTPEESFVAGIKYGRTMKSHIKLK